MPKERDFFRPHHEAAQVLYDAFQNEARLRKSRKLEAWLAAELDAVWRAAREYAQRNGLPAPSMDVVAKAESYARGSTDYGSKWAITIVNEMRWPLRLVHG